MPLRKTASWPSSIQNAAAPAASFLRLTAQDPMPSELFFFLPPSKLSYFFPPSSRDFDLIGFCSPCCSHLAVSSSDALRFASRPSSTARRFPAFADQIRILVSIPPHSLQALLLLSRPPPILPTCRNSGPPSSPEAMTITTCPKSSPHLPRG
ncbi:hypothetical protein VTK73DRAFT_5843 [Phialemonium thermophilum]|uniref:Uncharacterized protein n=1 Tax=Phialemonium thermophilum TaxID=223376 RepID=A0ABR3V104_9PEZI